MAIIVLVGPSGAGKTTIANELIKEKGLKKVVTTTTRAPRDGEVDGVDYHFITKEKFEEMKAADKFFESVSYAENYYGTSDSAVAEAAKSDDVSVMVLDINGAKALRTAYPQNVLTVFINRPYKDLVDEIIRRNVPAEDKVNRIRNIEAEHKNAKAQCNYSVDNENGALKQAVDEIAGIAVNFAMLNEFASRKKVTIC